MEKKAASGIMLILLILSMLTLAFKIQSAKAEPRTWTVDDDGPADFHTIQEAINAANLEDTIQVRVGTYYENIIIGTWMHAVNDLKIVGEDIQRTVINAHGGQGITIHAARNILLKSFTIRNGSVGIGVYMTDGGPQNCFIENCIITNNNVGIELNDDYAESITISYNIIEHNRIGVYGSLSRNIISNNIIWFNEQYGIQLNYVTGNLLSDNTITHNGYGGIYLSSTNPSYNLYNIIANNNLVNNGYFGMKIEFSYNNIVFHNNFVGNAINAIVDNSANHWDDGYPSGGNYWSDYTGVDADRDGIGDTSYVINSDNKDRYPLMEPWSSPAMITILVRVIKFWNLSKGIEKSLVSTLEAAYRSLKMGNRHAALGQLAAFINEVEAQKMKKLTDTQADYLIAETQRIIDLIEE